MFPCRRQRSASCLLGGSACLALLVTRGGAFFVSQTSQTASAVRRASSTSPTAAMSPFPTFAPEPFFPQEDSTVHQSCDQDFRGLFPPLHRPLSVLDISEAERGLWVYEQPLHTIPTVEMHNRMALVALSDGSTILYNPIAPTEETLREIKDSFGSPDHVIVPTTAYNNMVFVKGWAERFPRTTFWGLAGVKLEGAKFTRDLTMESFPESWKEELDLAILDGNGMYRECFLLHRTTRSVFAMDSFVEMGDENIPNPLLRAGSKMAGNFGRPVCPTKSLLWNRERCKAAMSKVLEWDFDKVYATHGVCPIQDAKEAMREEFQFLWD